MILTLTRSEMLSRLRLIMGLEPLRTDCSIEYTDGIDVDAVLEQHLRAWYVAMLDDAPPHLLAPTDISRLVVVSECPAPSGVVFDLPALCRRVFEVRMPGWYHTVAVRPPEYCEAVCSRQLNPFTRATTARPEAVLMPGGRSLMLFPAGQGSVPAMLSGIIDPGADSYVLDEAALAGLASLAKQITF